MNSDDRERLLADFAHWYATNPNLDIEGLTGVEVAQTVDRLWDAAGWGRRTQVSLTAPTVPDLEALYGVVDVALAEAPAEERSALRMLPPLAAHLFIEFLDVTGRWTGDAVELVRCRGLTGDRLSEVAADPDDI